MRVLEIEISNFMRLVAVHIEPTGAIVEIAGRNGQGKSTLLKAIESAVGGADVLPEKPIRKGEKTASIRVKLGDGKPTLVVTRTFAAKEDGGYTTQLHLEGPKGERFAKPQTQLDQLYGALAFDPFEFTRMKPADQLGQLRRLVQGIDFDALDAANRGDFERRTEVNRQAKNARARLAAIVIPGDPRHQRTDETALVAELEQAGEQNALIERRKANREEAARNAASERQGAQRCEARIAELRQEIAALEVEMQNHLTSAEATERKLHEAEELPAPIETSAIRARIDAARRTNAEIDARERAIAAQKALTEEADKAEELSRGYTLAIEEREAQKAAAVAAADLPVDGLGFGDDMVLLNGLPFSQASNAEQIRVSCAIAAAMNRDLKIMAVRDGSLLDNDSMALLREFAEKSGHQIWVEKVSAQSAAGIVIEDGRVANVGSEAAA